jgi:DNA helicase-2/ATP-dependent DNA helicase PcrA
MDKSEILKGLNEKQKEAVIQTEGPVLIVAGAGSGKTRTLIHRVAYLMATGVKPEKILALTFTNKAAEEMRERVKKILNKERLEWDRPFIGTFHKLGAKILREIFKVTGRTKNFVIFDQEDSRNLIKKCLEELDLAKEQFSPSAVMEEISRAKSELINAKDYTEKTASFFQEKVAKVYILYEEKLLKANAFDFDDLIKIPVEAMRKNTELLSAYQNRWSHILVDEYQDTNTSQYILIELLAEKHRNLCVVGDDDQSIYAWRQADFRNFLNFDKDWQDAKIIVLEESYRLTRNILAAAQEMVKNNKWRREKVLITNNPEGSPVFLIHAQDEIEEAEFVVGMILKLIEGCHYQPKDFAVLYRINAQSRVLEEALIKARLPYQIFAGVKFYERKEIKDLIAYLRLLVNPDDLISLERVINVPSRGIGEKKMEKILNSDKAKEVWENLKEIDEAKNFLEILEEGEKLIKNQPVAAILRFIIEATNYKKYLGAGTEKEKERWQNVLEFIRVAEDFDALGQGNLGQFLEQIALFQEGDEKKTRANAVQLMTLHSAKGLEFNIVFIVGCEEGILPHNQAQFSEEELEEERRLAYVGMTRAKKEVYLVFSFQRRLFGALSVNPPSRFLSEIPNALLQAIELGSDDEAPEDKIDPDYPEIEEPTVDDDV